MVDSVIIYVHSYVTVYLAKYLIENKYTNTTNIIVLYDRVHESDLEILDGKKFNFINSVGERFVKFNTFFSINSKVSILINEHIKSAFHLIVPHLYFDSLQIIANNSFCKKIVYLEEGDMSYQSSEELRFSFRDTSFEKKKFFRKLYSSGKLMESYPFPNCYKENEYVCFDKSAFPFVTFNKTVLDFKKVFKESNRFALNRYLSSIILLVNKTDLRYWRNNKEMYFEELNNAIRKLNVKNRRLIFVKPHPSIFSKTDLLNSIVNNFELHGLKVEFVEESLELLLVNTSDLRIITSPSSLIRYCYYAGVKPYFWSKKFLSLNSYHYKVFKQFENQMIVVCN